MHECLGILISFFIFYFLVFFVPFLMLNLDVKVETKSPVQLFNGQCYCLKKRGFYSKERRYIHMKIEHLLNVSCEIAIKSDQSIQPYILQNSLFHVHFNLAVVKFL